MTPTPALRPYRYPHAREFRPGDRVRLGPGGLTMRVVQVYPDGTLRLAWQSGGQGYVGRFGTHGLVRA